MPVRVWSGAVRRGRQQQGAAIGLALLAGAALAGCGGVSKADAYKQQLASSIAASYSADAQRATGRPTAPVEAPFLVRADAICAPVLAYNSAHPNPYPSFNYLSPDTATLPKIGAFFAASPYDDALGRLAALTPTQNAATWAMLATTARALRTTSLKQNAAALAGDAPAFTATIAPIEGLVATLAADANQAGFAPSSSCYRLFVNT